MYKQLGLVLIFSVIYTSAVAPKLNAKVYELNIQNDQQAQIVLSFEGKHGFDIWEFSKISGQKTRVMVYNEKCDLFEESLRAVSLDYEITINDVAKTLDEEVSRNLELSRAEKGITFTAYHRYGEMIEYMRNLTKTYPTLAKIENVGLSYENRTMYALRISNSTSNKTKPQIFIDGGIHAREWIAPAVALYIMNQLLEHQDQNRKLIEVADWLILPVVNPDGYEYTHTTNRLWRKTRSILKNTTCIGVDGNRNYGHHWGGPGSSNDPCSDVYSGVKAFTEPEVRVVRDLLLKENSTKIYLTLHSYGNLFLYPWGYTTDLPKDWERLHKLGTQAALKIKAVNGTIYTTGSSALALGMAAGSSRDFARGAANISTPYTVELPAGGQSGFELPPSKILSASQDIFAGIRYLAENINS